MRYVSGPVLDLSAYRLEEAPDPAPRPGEALVAVSACSLGYADGLLSAGRYQVKPPVPYTPGSDFAGIVTAVGEGASPDLIGQSVMGQGFGALAELVRIPVRALSVLPPGVSFAAASVLPTNYATALHALKDRANLQPGERLLVLGAAGGTGSAALDIGRILGAEVIAAASSEEKRRFALSRGAIAALDTDPQGWRERLKAATGGKGPDVVFDPVSGPLFEPAFRSLAWKGRHLVIGFTGGPIPALPANLPLLKGAALVGVDIRQFPIFESDLARSNLDQLLAWLADGRLTPAVGKVFALEDFAAALEHAMSGQGLGKTVVGIGD